MRRNQFLPVLALAGAAALCSRPAHARELVLAAGGSSNYQVVLPDQASSPLVGAWLVQVGRLVQAAFAANGAEVPVVAEADRNPAKPCIYLGDTAFARDHGVDVTRLSGWSYTHTVAGRDLIVAGYDHDLQLPGGSQHPRLGTAKGVVDFLSQYAGVRFLYPEVNFNLAPQANPAEIGRLDFAVSPEYEFLPTPKISVPAGLDLVFAPFVAHGAGRGRISFYELAGNKYPQVDETVVGHTWDKAAPWSEYAESNPDYFALIEGRRVPDKALPQYCLSNPDFQERVYRWILDRLDQGFHGTLLQPAGFKPCQCGDCFELYATGDDWGEKIWRFNREVAVRLEQEVPAARLFMSNFGVVAAPPQTFAAFPGNVTIGLVCPSAEDLAAWQDITVPGGFFAEIHNWSVFRGGGRVNHGAYTPMRTPLFISRQTELFRRHGIRTVFLEGAPYAYGLEGPVHYAWGRLLDAPGGNRVAELVQEFVDAAFGEAAAPMRRFYDQLYHGIELYANYLGVDGPAKQYTDIYGQERRHIEDPLQLLGFLYTPDLLVALDRELRRAEELSAANDRVGIRLAQVRLEFEWVRDIARVIHLYHAHQIAPEHTALRDLLLDAIDARNGWIADLYTEQGHRNRAVGWSGNHPFFPTHNLNHTRLGMKPFVDSPLNWDTAARRATHPSRMGENR